MAEVLIAAAVQVAISYATTQVMLALTPNGKAEGPRIGDRRVQTSQEGAPVPEIFGAMRVAGNFIDGKPEFDEIATTEQQGGKGGGGGVDITKYTYLATVATRLCRGPVGGIRRIWADTKIIWDISENGSTVPEPVFENGIQVGATFGEITCYFGNQTAADPTLEAIHGPDDTPAYLGEAYVVFNRFDITSWGRIPNITAEVLGSSTFGDKRTDYEHSQLSTSTPVFDPVRRSFYAASVGGIYTVDAAGGLSFRDLGDTSLDVSTIAYDSAADDAVTLTTAAASGNSALTYFNPRTGAVSKTVDLGLKASASAILYTASADDQKWERGMRPSMSASVALVGTLTDNGETTRKFICAYPDGRVFSNTSFYANTICLAFEPVNKRYVVGSDSISTGAASYTRGAYEIFNETAGHLSRVVPPVGQVIQALVASGAGEMWGIHTDGYISELKADLTAITCLDLNSSYDFYAAVFDASKNQLYIAATAVSVQNGARFVGSGRSIIIVDTENWVVVRTLALPANKPSATALAYDSTSSTLYSMDWKYSLQRLNPDDVFVQDIAETLIKRAGIASEKLEFDLLAAPSLIGFQKSTVMSTRAALAPLASAYAFDLVDTGYKIKLLSRGRDIAATIFEDQLLSSGSEDALVKAALSAEGELPSKIVVSYLDRAGDYIAGTQQVQRRLTASEAVQNIELPIVFDSNIQPAAIAQRILAESLAMSRKYTFNLPLDYLELEPGDSIKLVFNDGTQQTLLLSKVEVSFDALMVLCEAITIAQELYKELPAQPITTPPGAQQVISEIAAEAFELPALDDGDSGAPVAYIAAYPFIAGGWKQSVLFLSRDSGTTYTQQASLYRSTTGSCLTTLAISRQAAYTDATNTLSVRMQDGGTLSSTTRAELLNGANAAAILTASGAVEIIQFQTATLQADGSYLLSNLLNGRLGTEHVMAEHAAGERFILLKTSRLARQIFANSEINAVRYLKAVPGGSAIASAPGRAFTPTGRNLKPYSPAHARGVHTESGALVITWVRRSRLRGAWRSGIWAPLGEASEAYSVEILAEDGSVKRTLQASTPTLTYTATEQIADFGQPQLSVAIRIYQVSEAVGRGFPADARL